MPSPSEHALTILARMDGVVALNLSVGPLDEVTPTLRSVRLDGDVSALRPRPGQDVMLSLADRQGRHRWRRYTIRRLDDRGLELWVSLDSTGPGAAWASGADRGDTVEVVGPRGKIAVDPHATAHVFVVDESGLAAACAMAESLSAPARVHVVAPHEWAAVPTVRDGVTLSTAALPMRAEGRADPDQLAADLAEVLAVTRWPSLRATAGYVFGELGLTRDARGALVALGVPETSLAAKAYWRADRSNEDHGEPGRA